MTEDYKKKLIKYVTNLLNKEEPEPKDFNITKINEYDYSGDDWDIVVSQFRMQRAAINGILENEKYDNFIMYGGYQEEDGVNAKGFLVYLDKNGKPYKTLKTSFRGFTYLDFNEDTNRVYGTLSNRATNVAGTDNDVYFVYFNNLFIAETPIMTYSYRIWQKSGTSGGDVFTTRDIVKDPSGSNYLLFGSTYNGLYAPKILELKINVGSSNELNSWSVNTNYYYYASYGWYNESNPHFKIIGLKTNVSPKIFTLITDNGTSVSYSDLISDTELSNNQATFVRPFFIATNQNSIYFTYSATWTENNNTYKQCCLYKYNGNRIETIYKTSTNLNVDNNNLPMLNIVKDTDNTLYLLEFINNENDDTTIVKILNLSKHNIINDDDWVTIGTYNYIYRINVLNQVSLLKRNYNIANIFTYSGYFREGLGNPANPINGFQINIQNLSPINGYNGDEYEGVDCLVPQYSNLYSGGSLIFSRNLYNVTKQNNQTMASVEIPNSYLNDIEITKNNLISKTNVEMNNDNTNWTKNIYEVVDLNFLNTISVIDEDTNTNYQESAIKVNNSITDGGNTNYQNTPCNQFRINYDDETTLIKPLYWSSIDDKHKKTKISFYADKLINSIDLISNDSSVIYLHIPVETEVGKYYTINQKIKVE